MSKKPKRSVSQWYWQGVLTIAIFLLGLIPATSLACASITLGPGGYIALLAVLISVQFYMLVIADMAGLRPYRRIYPWLLFGATVLATLALAALYALPMLQAHALHAIR